MSDEPKKPVVFISWSGKASEQGAMALKDWIEEVFHIQAFMSKADIPKGARGESVLADHLKEAAFGIVCLTPYSHAQPWVLFEAGALTRTVDRTRVSAVLVGIKWSDVKPPIASFQATSPNDEDLTHLATSVNETLGGSAREPMQLARSVKKNNPELIERLETAAKLAAAEAKKEEVVPGRTAEEMFEETVGLVRGMRAQLSDLTFASTLGALTPGERASRILFRGSEGAELKDASSLLYRTGDFTPADTESMSKQAVALRVLADRLENLATKEKQKRAFEQEQNGVVAASPLTVPVRRRRRRPRL